MATCVHFDGIYLGRVKTIMGKEEITSSTNSLCWSNPSTDDKVLALSKCKAFAYNKTSDITFYQTTKFGP